MKRKNVIIYQRILPHYRVPFFERLAKKLKENGVDLLLVYGNERMGTVPTSVDMPRPWTKKVNNFYFETAGFELCFQPILLKNLLKCDVLVVEQSNRLLSNYIFFMLNKLKILKFAFWGHGKNFQSSKSTFREKFKRMYSNKVDWWFTYTKSGSEILEKTGFERGRISILNNTIDTEGLSSVYADSEASRIHKFSKNTCIYCGGLYKEKRISFLIDACLKIRVHIPDFELIIIGDGPDYHLLEEFISLPWVHYLGAIKDYSRANYFRRAKLQLMPGLVGLAIIDSFTLQTPIVTTDIDYHSPEYDYLENEVNGLVTDDDSSSYANKIVEVLNDEIRLATLIDGCRRSSKKFSLDNMVESFSDGLLKLLGNKK